MLLISRFAFLLLVFLLPSSVVLAQWNGNGGGNGNGGSDPVPQAAPGGGGGGGGPTIANYELESLARLNVQEDLTPYGTDLLGEGFDLATGALSFRHVDVSIPGNSSLEVAVHRSLRTAVRRFRKTDEFVDWSLDVPNMSLIVPRSRGWETNRCTGPLGGIEDILEYGVFYLQQNFSNGLQLNIPGQGSRTVLDSPLAPVNGAGVYGTTNDYWRITCHTLPGAQGEGFIATSPDGITYTFGDIRPRPAVTATRCTASAAPCCRRRLAESRPTTSTPAAC